MGVRRGGGVLLTFLVRPRLTRAYNVLQNDVADGGGGVGMAAREKGEKGVKKKKFFL